jgi:hypothetical protein
MLMEYFEGTKDSLQVITIEMERNKHISPAALKAAKFLIGKRAELRNLVPVRPRYPDLE